MKKQLLLIAVVLFAFSFSVSAQHAAAGSIDTLASNIRLSPRGQYGQVKQSIRMKRDSIVRRYGGGTKKDSLYAAAKVLLEESIVNRLIPFWYGTEWDFNGYTAVPGRGVIACGYFVSTVLRDCGCVVNRYALAQQSPLFEALSIQCGDSVQIYESGIDAFLRDFRRNNEEGLCFAGLDCHVGFLLYRSGELYFIHSSYLDPLCVVIEKAAFSPAFNATSTYTIARISNNKKLLDGWLRGVRIEVVRE